MRSPYLIYSTRYRRLTDPAYSERIPLPPPTVNKKGSPPKKITCDRSLHPRRCACIRWATAPSGGGSSGRSRSRRGKPSASATADTVFVGSPRRMRASSTTALSIHERCKEMARYISMSDTHSNPMPRNIRMMMSVMAASRHAACHAERTCDSGEYCDEDFEELAPVDVFHIF